MSKWSGGEEDRVRLVQEYKRLGKSDKSFLELLREQKQ
jgi:hypothetical protein